MRHHAQEVLQAPLVNSYNDEEVKLIQKEKCVPRSSVQKLSNIIGSTVYNLKLNDDNYLKLKAKIVPNGNEDSGKENFWTDCFMWPPIGILIVASTLLVSGSYYTQVEHLNN